MKNPECIIISRTDSIGDVILTLPMAGAIKEKHPDCKVIFLCNSYTKDVVGISRYIDEIANWDEAKSMILPDQMEWIDQFRADIILHVLPSLDIAKAAKGNGIKYRVGSTGRIYHYFYCNRIIPLSRRNSNYHESQLNFQLLGPVIGNTKIPSLDQIADYIGINQSLQPESSTIKYLDPKKFNLILHPKSKGSAREWPLAYYSELMALLPQDKFKLFITGTNEEGQLLKDFIHQNKHIATDLTGKFSLLDFISFIQVADGLVAASTGPLHIAAAMNKLAIGLYPPIRPMHPGRWAPIGKKAHYLVSKKRCNDCRKSLSCHCMSEIAPNQVLDLILKNA